MTHRERKSRNFMVTARDENAKKWAIRWHIPICLTIGSILFRTVSWFYLPNCVMVAGFTMSLVLPCHWLYHVTGFTMSQVLPYHGFYHMMPYHGFYRVAGFTVSWVLPCHRFFCVTG